MLRRTLALAALVLLAGCTPQTPQRQETVASSAPASSVAPLPQPDWAAMTGALVDVRMRSTVGVLLDEIPPAYREDYAAAIAQQSLQVWQERAHRQIRLTSLRLSYRYAKGKKQLPLPPEELWEVRFDGTPQRLRIDGHDVVAMPYAFSTTILADAASVAVSEPALAAEGGTWSEHFLFPVDPDFLFQRTEFACMNESQFPPNSMDAEESDLFYDDRCGVETRLSVTGCHQTALPQRSCVTAVREEVGGVQSSVVFTRLAWDGALASRVRRGTVTNLTGPDLAPHRAEFLKNRTTYRYIAPSSCAVQEQCVTGTGWRQLLMFPTADLNAGMRPLDIGFVDYFLQGKDSVLEKHGVFELSKCHNHYHFSHYGSFSLGDSVPALTRKNGFCLQPTARLWNNEASPLHHPYIDCLLQGVAPGWIDEYRMGLDCQWLDVTGLPTDRSYPLTFETNPEGFLCEGTAQKDADGRQIFESTDFTTTDGRPVSRPACAFAPRWQENNTESYDVVLLRPGESYVTQECAQGISGPLRNCGLDNAKFLHTCTPGEQVTLDCRTREEGSPQIVRVCEGSRAHQMGIPCTYNDALAQGLIDGALTQMTFVCPRARDAGEDEGAYSYLSGPLFSGESAALVECLPRSNGAVR